MPADPPSMRPASGPIAEGTVMAGKYCLEGLLGSGAQGWVWAARNLDLDVPVAIKLLRRDGDDERQSAQRLFREARSAARLGHPAIVRVFDLGEDCDGSPFIVMERLRGETLADRLGRDGCLSPELAVRTMLPIADALLATHSEGIIHRDVKPANVFLAVNGSTLQPKLMDFGIARFARGTGLSSGAGPSSSVTQDGAIVGTPSYVSPEQARGLWDVDHRSDMWSFCTTLYECMTLGLPFDGTTWPELCRSILADEPRSLLEAGVADDALWRILDRGLSKAPEDRFENMLELGKELATWLLRRDASDDICGTSVEAHWLRRGPMALGVNAERTTPSPDRSQPTLDVKRSQRQRSQSSTLDAAEGDFAMRRSGSTLGSMERPLSGGLRPRHSARWLAVAATALSAFGLGGMWHAGASLPEAPPAADAQTSPASQTPLSAAPLTALGALASTPPAPTRPAPTPPAPTRPAPTTPPAPTPPPVPTTPQAQSSPSLARAAPVAGDEAARAASAAPRSAAFSSKQRASAESARLPNAPRSRVHSRRGDTAPDLIDPYAPVLGQLRSSHDESRLPGVLGSRDGDRPGLD